MVTRIITPCKFGTVDEGRALRANLSTPKHAPKHATGDGSMRLGTVIVEETSGSRLHGEHRLPEQAQAAREPCHPAHGPNELH